MSTEMAVEVFRLMLMTALIVVAPMLLTAMFIGVIVSLFQAVTSIQEQTLSFVPKLVGVSLVLMFFAYNLIEKVTFFAEDMFQRIAGMLN
ncbi:MAG: flagellar biosynthetic protein FliQ [Opitutales bacterium]